VLSPDGKRLAASGNANDLTLWDAADGKEVRRFVVGTPVTAAAFAPDGRSLAAASADAPVFVWEVAGTSGPRQKRSAE
jgi:WD40 repeat protein